MWVLQKSPTHTLSFLPPSRLGISPESPEWQLRPAFNLRGLWEGLAGLGEDIGSLQRPAPPFTPACGSGGCVSLLALPRPPRSRSPLAQSVQSPVSRSQSLLFFSAVPPRSLPPLFLLAGGEGAGPAGQLHPPPALGPPSARGSESERGGEGGREEGEKGRKEGAGGCCVCLSVPV